MKRLIATLVLMTGFSLLAGAPARAADATDGYVTLETPQPTNDPSKVEVVEMFSYGCPHCFHFEPLLHDWVKKLPNDVVFERVPVVFRPNWEPLARAYYVAETLGVLDKIHEPLFKAIHEQNQTLDSEDAMAKFFATQGVDEKQFHEAYNSFSVAAKLNRGRELLKRYGISGVPTLVINGKYRTSANEAGGHEGMLKTADMLIAKERAALKPAAAK